jgi:hypothetical protein
MRTATGTQIGALHATLGRHAGRGVYLARRVYDALGVFGTILPENIGVFHSRPLKMAPKTPNAL